MAKNETRLKDAHDIDALKRCDIIITAQGGDYTSEVYPKLRAAGWKGHWIDAASTLRMKDDAVIVLDPVNLPVIQKALSAGGRNWIGGNCTVSCMLMGVGRALQGRPGRVDEHDDLPGGLGRWGAAHARAADAVRHAERRGAASARRSEERDPRDRPARRRDAARPQRSRDRKLRRAAGRLADPVDRQGPWRRQAARRVGLGHEPRGVEGRRRDQQDPRPGRGLRHAARCRSTASACASARCAATARR